MNKNLGINSDRLWDSLMEMAKIGATANGGCCRLALTDLDKEGRDLFVKWCKEADCSVTVDAIGNVFARRSGRQDALPAVIAGSHLDTQPTGGKFDGVYGVLAGLEVVRTLDDHEIETESPVEVCVWSNEEGSRFSPPMMGSGVFAHVFEVDEIRAKRDIDDSTFGEELDRIGYAGKLTVGDRAVGAYFEAHIEQGPILENQGKVIGVVTGGHGQRWHEITVTGQESHAGPTPMSHRYDALVTASQIVSKVNQIGHAYPPHACATVGSMQVSPNSRNVIPGSVFLTVDMRHPEDPVLTRMDVDLKEFCHDLAIKTKVAIDIEDFWYSPPTAFDEGCIAAVRKGANAKGYSHMDIVSGAGHDAIYMARVAPTSMIFIPCEGGLSHNELEAATKDDCAAGCNVLLHAVLDKAKPS